MLWGVLATSAADERSVIKLEKLLEAPVSPGVATLLVPHGSDTRALERLREALKSPRPETRAAAARAAHVAYAKALVPALHEVLAIETGAEPAREQIRALAALGGPPSDSSLKEAAKRFGGRLDAALLEALARARGPGATAVIVSEEWAATVSPALRGELLLIASRGDHAAISEPVQRLLDRRDAAVWRALVQTPRRGRNALDPSVAALGLRSPDEEIAGTTAWEMAQRRASDGSAAQPIPAPPSPPEGSGADTLFAFELLSRSMGAKPQIQTAWIASLETREKTIADGLRPGAPIFGLMEPAERSAIRKRFVRKFPKQEYPASSWEAWTPLPPADPSQDAPVLRLFSNLPRGAVGDTLAASGCKPKKDGAFGAAEVYYNVEGRPGRVRRIDADVSRACDAASTALFLMSLAPRSQLPVRGQQVMLAFAHPDCMDELDEPDVAARAEVQPKETLRFEENVQPPRLVGKVEPIYPMKSRVDGRQGVVVLEAVISRNGCVREIETIQGVDPVLDYSAARAVSQWRYQPATLDGKPVQVYLTVTVTFRLHP